MFHFKMFSPFHTSLTIIMFTHLFRFPKEQQTLKKWIEATGRTNWEPNKNSRLCSAHFEAESFNRTKKITYLNPLACPTKSIHNMNVSKTINCSIFVLTKYFAMYAEERLLYEIKSYLSRYLGTHIFINIFLIKSGKTT